MTGRGVTKKYQYSSIHLKKKTLKIIKQLRGKAIRISHTFVNYSLEVVTNSINNSGFQFDDKFVVGINPTRILIELNNLFMGLLFRPTYKRNMWVFYLCARHIDYLIFNNFVIVQPLGKDPNPYL